jgi:hypothetical protein
MLHLTGSRYFGKRSSSDFDFFMQNSIEAQRELLGAGFKRVPTIGKCGPNMVAMYRKGNIDVGLVEDLDRKKLEQKILSVTPARALMCILPKPLRTFLWNIVQQI